MRIAVHAFDGITYTKGAAVIAMFESLVGKESFRAGVQQYLKDHAHKTATSSELMKALDKSSGKDVATGIGVLAGAAIGSRTGRGDNDQQVVTTPNVQRCSRNPSQARAAYWDVAYNFRGQEYRVQMTQAPGRTIGSCCRRPPTAPPRRTTRGPSASSTPGSAA